MLAILTALNNPLSLFSGDTGSADPNADPSALPTNTGASPAALERLQAAQRALNQSIASPEEKFALLTEELAAAQEALTKMTQGTEQYVNQQSKLLGLEKQVFEAGKSIKTEETKAAKMDKESPYSLGSIGLGSVGGYGTTRAGIVTDNIERQALTEAQKTARNTAEIARRMAQPANDAWQ